MVRGGDERALASRPAGRMGDASVCVDGVCFCASFVACVEHPARGIRPQIRLIRRSELPSRGDDRCRAVSELGCWSRSALGLAAAVVRAVRGCSARWRGGCAARLGFLDRPGGHKGHQTPAPLGGGVAIWLATVIVLACCGLAVLLGGRRAAPADGRHVTPAGSSAGPASCWRSSVLATVIMVMGLVDDRKNLNWQLRLGIQVACAAILAASGIRVTLFWPFTHPLLGGAVTVFWIVGLTNSFNMLDNMDGLAASVGLIAAVLFCVGAGGGRAACSLRRSC